MKISPHCDKKILGFHGDRRIGQLSELNEGRRLHSDHEIRGKNIRHSDGKLQGDDFVPKAEQESRNN